MPALIHRKLLRHGFAELALGLESNEIAAAHHALQWARPGEVLALPVHGAGTRGALLVELGAGGGRRCVRRVTWNADGTLWHTSMTVEPLEIRMSSGKLRWPGYAVFTMLAACGGGDGGDGGTPTPPRPAAALAVDMTSVSVSAGTDDPAPTATVHASVSNAGTASYFFASTATGTGLATVTNPPSGTAGDFTLQFKTPASLGVGTYSDTFTVKAFTDSACQQPISGSPVTVSVSYAVSIKPHISSLGPNVVAAGGTSFSLFVYGSHFDSTSVAQVNGADRQTLYLSSGLLTVELSAQDIASAGSIPVTVTVDGDSGLIQSLPSVLTVSSGTVPLAVSNPTSSVSATSNTSIGGGPEVRQAFTEAVNGPTNATYYYMMSYTGSAVSRLDVNGTLQSGTTTPAGSPAGRVTGEPNGGLGGIVRGSFTGPTLANIGVELVNAAQMGAGTYTDVVTVTICTDALCAHPIGTAQTVNITYVVTGNPIPNTEFSLLTGQVTLEAATSTTSPVTARSILSSNGLPTYGAYAFATVLGGTALSGASFQSNLDGTSTLTITSKSASALGSGIYADSVQVRVCFDAACSKPAPGFPQVIPVTYIVDAAAGIDFTQQSVAVEIADLAYSTVRDRIYATANSDTGGLQHSLVVINPSTATIEQIVSLGSQSYPTTITVTDDGQFAYILDDVANTVVRVALGTLTIDETVQLTLGEGYIKSAPGQSGTFAVETDDSNFSTLRIFDGTVQRSQVFTSSSEEIPLSFSWAADATGIYAYDRPVANPSLYKLTVSANGESVAQQTPLQVPDLQVDDIQYSNGSLYFSGGSIYDISSGVVRTLPLINTNANGVVQGEITLDPALPRVYALTNDTAYQSTTGQTIEGFNPTTLQPTWIARFPSIRSRVIRWGTNGLAYFDGDPVNPSVVLISGNVVTR